MMPVHSHRMSYSPEYSIWQLMKRRCLNERAADYPRYGGRGITVCDRWMSFQNFIDDVGLRPSAQHSLDRTDNNGNYEPGNVRWATQLEQANNKRTSHLIIYRGQLMTIADAARAAGADVRRETAVCRIKNGWSVEDAVETPPLFRRDPATRKKIRDSEASA